MVNFIWDHRDLVVVVAIVMCWVTASAYLFGQFSQTAYDRWAWYVTKFLGFLTIFIVLPVGPWLIYRMVTDWSKPANQSGVFILPLVWTIMAIAAALVHLVGFPKTTYRMIHHLPV